ncbi:hypothetical protein NC653_017859 [Populus alba x Populus x berolinensis]|uniref:Uncharacterized protein n=1 Tax=Populus alba x Populus x berolinensis TaxID=444605 RepID=A0AAD6QRQ5_9ROSI|nr:hypothetical protein NC653_017859 [Populus alba x Populus x berolinensis]
MPKDLSKDTHVWRVFMAPHVIVSGLSHLRNGFVFFFLIII